MLILNYCIQQIKVMSKDERGNGKTRRTEIQTIFKQEKPKTEVCKNY